MTNLSTVQELTEVIQLCLTSKLRESHDASVSLTLDIARLIATEIEERCKAYTNTQLSELMSTIHNEDVDLTTFREFINSIKGLLDGSDEDGYQLFNLLVTDVADHTRILELQSIDLSEIKTQLAENTLAIKEHNVRLTTLEAEPSGTEVKGEMVDLMESVFESACVAVSDKLQEYRENAYSLSMAQVTGLNATYRAVLDISLLASDNLLVTCKLTDDIVVGATLTINGSEPLGPVSYNPEKKVLSALLLETPTELIGKIFSITTDTGISFTGVFQPLSNYPIKNTFT